MIRKQLFNLALMVSLLSACLSAKPDTKENDEYPLPDTGTADASTDYVYKITWSDGDLAGQLVSIFYSDDLEQPNPKLIVRDIPAENPENAFYWNTAVIPDGSYYIFVRLTGDSETRQLEPIGPINIQHPTSCFDISARKNLLANSSFEMGTGSKIKDWSYEQAGRGAEFEWVDDETIAHSGSRAIMFSNVFNGVNSPSNWRDLITVQSKRIDLPTAGGKYLFTAWVKTENVETGHVQFSFDYFNRFGQALKLKGHDSDTFYAWVDQTSDWTQVSFVINLPHWDSLPYAEDARAEKLEAGFSLESSAGRLWVDDVSLVEISEAEYAQLFPGNRFPAPEIRTIDTSLTFHQKEGWLASVQQDPQSGVWWMVGSDQTAFWALGVSTNSSDKVEAATGLDSSVFQDQARYLSKAELNFNIGWRKIDDSTTENFIYRMNFSSNPDIEAAPETWTLRDRDGNLLGSPGHYFPDVFSPVWQTYAQSEAQSITKGKGWILESDRVIGYFTDNEFSYGDLYDFLWGDTAKLAFVDWLQGKNDLPSVDKIYREQGLALNLDVPTGFERKAPYESIAQVNQAWSSPFHTYRYATFEAIYGSDKPYIRSHDDPVMADLYAFERVIYKLYVDTVIGNIRRVENEYIQREGAGYHRPIFSNRFHLKSPAALHALQRNMDIFSEFDVIAVNLYPTINQYGTFLPYEVMSIVKSTFHDSTGRPLFVSEFGVASEDADNYDEAPYLTVERWRKKTVPYEYQRGWAYRNLISTWANLPWVIGADWFSWANRYGTPVGSDVRNSGLVDDYGQYYSGLTDQIRSVNWDVNHILRSPDFSLEDIQWESVDIRICPAVE